MDRFYYEGYGEFGSAFYFMSPSPVLNYLQTLDPENKRHVDHTIDSHILWVAGGEFLQPILELCAMLSIECVQVEPTDARSFVKFAREYEEKHNG